MTSFDLSLMVALATEPSSTASKNSVRVSSSVFSSLPMSWEATNSAIAPRRM